MSEDRKKEIMKILAFLKSKYDEDPNDFTGDTLIAQTINLDEKKTRGILMYMEQDELVQIVEQTVTVWFWKIRKKGIDKLEEKENMITTEPVPRPSYIAHEIHVPPIENEHGDRTFGDPVYLKKPKNKLGNFVSNHKILIISIIVGIAVGGTFYFGSNYFSPPSANGGLSHDTVRFHLSGNTYAFEIKNNKNTMIVDSDGTIGISSSMAKPLEFDIASDQQLDVKQFYVHRTVDDPLYSDEYLIPERDIRIMTDFLIINSTQNIQYQINSNNAGIESHTYRLTLVNATNMRIIVPQGDSDYLLSLSDNSRVWVGGLEYTPIGGWSNHIVRIHLTSGEGGVIPGNGNFIIQNNLKKLDIDSTVLPLDLMLSYVGGNVATSAPKETNVNLSSADTVNLRGVHADTKIKNNPDGGFEVNLVGSSDSILVNNNNILSQNLFPDWIWFSLIWPLVTAIIGGVVVGVILRIRILK